MKARPLSSTALEKIWGTPETEPWFPASGKNIGEVWFTAPEEPRLLVKFLFTSESLSVQVHPPDTAAGAGKTEMWHVLRAAPDARLALGFTRELTSPEARAAAASGEIERLLHWYKPQPGDTFFVPAGTVHAIGPGLVLCEIQQYSDVTYRLYDYGRPRELHLDQAFAVAQLRPHPGATPPLDLGTGRRLLAECPYFRTESILIERPLTYAAGPHPELLICVAGEGRLDDQTVSPGQVWALPADTAGIQIHPSAPVRLLRTFVP